VTVNGLVNHSYTYEFKIKSRNTSDAGNALSSEPTGRKGLVACVFDTTDRMQHMFFRCLEGSHPANQGRKTGEYSGVIRDLYGKMDEFIGRVLKKLDDRTLLLVMSDHGFAPFRRGVNINTWLLKNGYLHLQDNAPPLSEAGNWFAGVDWTRTRAYALGLAGLFINRKGREGHGIVGAGKETAALKQELSEKLTGLKDPDKGAIAVKYVVDTETAFSGPYKKDAPDLLICYNRGYRHSWKCASGAVSETVFEDNTQAWSGDHCMDPQQVPGVLFSNKKLRLDKPGIMDIGPTVLDGFGIDVPKYMQGNSLLNDE